MDYQPQPIDTSKIELGPELVELTEYLARNTHEVWARGRIIEGWRYGPRRDDANRLHPGLVPYSELTEGEKQFDRDTALETLKVILASGYRIEPPAIIPAGAAPAAEPDARSLGLVQLLDLWQSWARETRDGRPRAPRAYAALGERALELGENLLAYD